MNLVLPHDATSDTTAAWLQQLVRDFGLGFHLDTSPEDYFSPEGQPCFTPDECRVFGDSLARLFEILGDTLPYEIAAAAASTLLAESRGWKPPLHYHDPFFQRELLNTGTRAELIDWLCWNDPNGTYTDQDSVAADCAPLALAEARRIMLTQIEREHPA